MECLFNLAKSLYFKLRRESECHPQPILVILILSLNGMAQLFENEKMEAKGLSLYDQDKKEILCYTNIWIYYSILSELELVR